MEKTLIYVILCEWFGKQTTVSQKALAIYDDLQKNGKDYSQNSYAMALYNTGIISMQQNNYEGALEYARKASLIWDKILLTSKDTQIEAYVAESQKLIDFLKIKILIGK